MLPLRRVPAKVIAKEDLVTTRVRYARARTRRPSNLSAKPVQQIHYRARISKQIYTYLYAPSSRIFVHLAARSEWKRKGKMSQDAEQGKYN